MYIHLFVQAQKGVYLEVHDLDQHKVYVENNLTFPSLITSLIIIIITCIITLNKSLRLEINFRGIIEGPEFLNQAHTSLWLARTWFLKIASVRTSVCMCVLAYVCTCMSAPEAINN